ncbi:glycoside hydrolase family 2 TIM barrel-domain containing protein [Streptomyces sp. NPDC008343]|uniref:glycoside hydrolase family 2 protein n=1 Tax=Streptomyces sp. NPDC008343 TaxID=3364828 RepID=UPI0036EEE05A
MRHSEISRRNFLAAAAAGTLAATTWSVVGSAGTARAANGADSRLYPLNRRWRFIGHDVAEADAVKPGFNDGGYPEVRLPHTTVPLSWHDWDLTSWANRAVYRRKVKRPSETSGMRVFLDFEGALTAATVTVNGTSLPEHLGGYLPFNHEVTDLLEPGKEGVVAVTVDGTWRQIPPDGRSGGSTSIDFMEPSGLHRQVSLRAVPQMFISDVWASPADVLDSAKRRIDVACEIDAAVAPSQQVRLVARLWDGSTKLAESSTDVTPGTGTTKAGLTLNGLSAAKLWSVDSPKLYDLFVLLYVGDTPVHRFRRRVGFREARFETDGFYLNGEKLQIFGLNRHEIYPYVGMSMPPRVHRRDAEILREELNCNMVRCSHYPQSEAFLDACDELGLLVFEELPGWQYIGGTAWQNLAVGMAEDMVVRDRSRPSVVLWGARINETGDSGLHPKCDEAIKALDPTRQTTGAMNQYSDAELAGFDHDVFSYNDYSTDPMNSNTLRLRTWDTTKLVKPYLISESVGQFPNFNQPYLRTSSLTIQQDQCMIHAQAHEQAAAMDICSGLLGWVAWDYPSPFGKITKGMKWSGISDIFRVPKPGAAIYTSQVSPQVRPVIAPAFHWDFTSPSPATGPGANAMICSNCDTLKIYLDGVLKATVTPDTTNYGHLAFPPSFANLTVTAGTRPELRIDGYVSGQKVVTRTFSGSTTGDKLSLKADDTSLTGDGSDATRVVFRVVDVHGSPRPYTAGDVTVDITGPGVLVGDTPFDLGANGGVGAVWIRTLPAASGTIKVTAKLAGYPDATASIAVAYSAAEVA